MTIVGSKVSELPVAIPTRSSVLYGVPPSVQFTAGAVLALALDTDLTFSDVTTGNASATKHGYLPKLPNNTFKYLRGDGTFAEPGLLAVVSYNPTLTDVSVTSTTGTDLDATNLAVTFTVPISGKVLIGLCATAFSATNGVGLMFLLRDTVGNNIAGTKRQVTAASTTTSQQLPVFHRMYITGLTPGASVTYRWGVMVTSAGTGHVRYGDDSGATGQEYGPAVMEVWAAP